jgi:hypothetical protein
VKVVSWDDIVLIYKSHIFHDVGIPKGLFKYLEDDSRAILTSEEISYESVYLVVLFAYRPAAFQNNQEAAYECGRQLLEKDKRFKL